MTDAADATNVSHIFAIGDVLHGRPELTPVAIQVYAIAWRMMLMMMLLLLLFLLFLLYLVLLPTLKY